MATRTFTLTEHFQRFIDDSVASGDYADPSEVMHDALRLLEQRRREDELKLQRLREAVQVGIDAMERGDYVELGRDELHDHIARLGEEAVRRSRSRDDAA